MSDAIFVRVKKLQMRLSNVARAVVSDMVDGRLAFEGPEYLNTRRGKFRLCMGDNSDNNLEKRFHSSNGARTVIMSADDQMQEFFLAHGLPETALNDFHKRVKDAL